MKPKNIILNHAFTGRFSERKSLKCVIQENEASIVILYGRRRVGKTELLEQTFRNRNILKFEGIEGKSESWQIKNVMRQLAIYAEEPILAEVHCTTWSDVFRYIHKYTSEGTWTIYFEELQWLANYNDSFISELKSAWDNQFRHNANLILILCGSSPSFMINHVVLSKSLYNRSQHEMHLKEFNLIDTHQFLSHYPLKDIMDAYLTVGGIPEYLKKITKKSSLLLGILDNSFAPDGFFTNEYQKIFLSSLNNNPNYKKIIELLSKKRFFSREEIIKHINSSSGGRMTVMLDDLVACGFIDRYSAFNTTEDSKLVRYCISDAYLQFYFKFIKPKLKDIQSGRYAGSLTQALNRDTYAKWLGFSFERFCRRYAHVISKILGFSSVNYRSGAFFNRSIQSKNPGYQIDLVFDRDDNVITICEIKYLQTKVSSTIIEEVERKIQLFPKPKRKIIQRVLITTEGVNEALAAHAYFDNIITLDDLFDPHYWK
ncbi:MAG: ATP-binding protein [Gammaproteobacteria bacterium]